MHPGQTPNSLEPQQAKGLGGSIGYVNEAHIRAQKKELAALRKAFEVKQRAAEIEALKRATRFDQQEPTMTKDRMGNPYSQPDPSRQIPQRLDAPRREEVQPMQDPYGNPGRSRNA